MTAPKHLFVHGARSGPRASDNPESSVKWIAITLTLLFAACAGFVDLREKAITRAEQAGFSAARVPAGRFHLFALHRGLGQSDTTVVYIEGDGSAWKTQTRLSDDPTPRKPIALEMALRDPSSAILYLARPCQYLTREELEHCEPRFWSTYRYSEEVIAAMDSAVDWAIAQSGRATRLGLVGYSGGGAVATLLAARRTDVQWLITVAGNLDHASWTTFHDITPLTHSLNPVDYAETVRTIPQLHLIGERDTNVPYAVLGDYVDRIGAEADIRVEIVPGFTHECCWQEHWPGLMCRFGVWPSAHACTTNQAAIGRKEKIVGVHH